MGNFGLFFQIYLYFKNIFSELFLNKCSSSWIFLFQAVIILKFIIYYFFRVILEIARGPVRRTTGAFSGGRFGFRRRGSWLDK